MTVPEARPVTGTRIRWEAGAEAGLSAWLGLVGEPPLFAYAINRPPAGETQHTLVSQLPRPQGQYADGDPDDLKAAAEDWFQGYVSRLGAFFPDAFRSEVESMRGSKYQLAADHEESGHDWQTERAFGAVDALDWMLATIDRMAGAKAGSSDEAVANPAPAGEEQQP